MIPSSVSVQRAYPGYPRGIAVTTGLQVILNDRLQVRGIAAHLLALLSEKPPEKDVAQIHAKRIPVQSKWLSSSLISLWRSMTSGPAQLIHNFMSLSSITLFLQAVRVCHAQMQGQSISASLAFRITNLLLETTLTLLKDTPLPLMSFLEETLCINLLEIAALSQSSDDLDTRVSDFVAKPLTDLIADKGRFERLGHDLRVRMVLL